MINSIPKVIHQIWYQGGDLPPFYQSLRGTWIRHHPEWQFIIWNKEDMRILLEEHYNDYLDLWDGYDHWIYRVDIFRTFALHHYGGVYIDVDFECLRPLNELFNELGDFQVAFCEEAEENKDPDRPDEKPIKHYDNAFIISSKGHGVWRTIWELFRQRKTSDLQLKMSPNVKTFETVLQRTGPELFTHALDTIGDAIGLGIVSIPNQWLFPLSWFEFRKIKFTVDEEARKEAHDVIKGKKFAVEPYGIHYWAASWLNKKDLQSFLIDWDKNGRNIEGQLTLGDNL
jgi:mannosyltransferase OCH1-like enzyme